MKNKFFYIGLFLGILVFVACNETVHTQESVPAGISAAAEDELLLRLSSELVNNPRTQAEIEQNQLLEYAIDQLVDVQVHPKGFYYQIIREGNGGFAKWGDYVTAHYKGNFLSGKTFDSSYQRGEPLSFYVGNMIEGWNEGLALMQAGTKAVFLIPSSLAYGEKGLKKLVEPNTPLIFEVELIKISSK